jgi:hypothetical protein
VNAVDGALAAMTARGWPLLICHPRSKAPLGELVPHGVRDATTDRDVIARWARLYPDANWAVACGAPGPQVLDIDNPGAVPAEVAAAVMKAPRTASARGGAAFFQGTDAGTINLGWGELRGRGSYQLVPPSVHPSGRPYEWRVFPRGPLPPVPPGLARAGRRAGQGEREAPAELVPHGERHPHLLDVAVRLLRAGIADRRRLEAHLRCEFELACDPLPAPGPGYFEDMAKWAAGSRIADREHDHRALVLGDAGLQNVRPLR